ncbi:MAG: hypothetical protein M3340_03730 [Actinomycetota bacterium]|nr:hypothetical protein [Actinomycetota bacterium]
MGLARRCLLLAATAAVFGLLASAATAAEHLANCGNLQSTIDGASDGDTITLGGECTGSYTISKKDLTIRGDPANGTEDGFVSATGRALTGVDSGAVTIRDLFFVGRAVVDLDGGAISLTGDVAPVIDDCEFRANAAVRDTAGGAGGAVSISQAFGATGDVVVLDSVFGGAEVESRNSADGVGGALQISANGRTELTGNSFLSNLTGRWGGGASVVTGRLHAVGNRFEGNSAVDSGGGAKVILISAGGTQETDLTGNEFLSNTVTGGWGGGLHLDRSGGRNPPPTTRVIRQSGNRFERNRLLGVNPIGAGEAIEDLTVTSTDDRFVRNDVDAPGGGGGGVGAMRSTLRARNLVAAGNEVTGGAGGGIMAFEGNVNSPASIELVHSTVAGNTVDGTSTAAGIDGDSLSSLTLSNSIVFGNTGGSGPEIAGFPGGNVTASFSDACDGGAALAGTGNLCVDPLFADLFAGDVHLNAGSPVLEMGGPSLVPADLTTDFDGQARVQDANGDGTAVPDMGADERVGIPGPASGPGDGDAPGDGGIPGDGGAPGDGGTTQPLPDMRRPLLDSFVLRFTVFAVGPDPTPPVLRPAARVRRGTEFRFKVDEAGTATITIERVLPGRLAKKKCRKPSRTNANRKACRRFKRAGKLLRAAKPGTNKVPFSGRIGAKALKPGGYRASVQVMDAGGNRSKVKRLGFRIVAG